MIRFFSLAGTTAAAVLALGRPALADPAQETVPLQCGDYALTVAVAPANGTFTPNFDTNSTDVFKPTLLEITKTVQDALGQQISSATVTEVLGQGKQARRTDAVNCAASQTLPGDWVGLPSDETLVISVNATGFFTPRHQ